MKRKHPEEILNKISAKKKPIYENCSVYAIEGELLFRCNRKKINWYLSRDLAETIEPKEGEDIAIRLKFVAKGKSQSDMVWRTEDRSNQCCVCGALEHLNLHHVFPYVYRKWCPELIKSHTHHDILPLCTLCHANYEIHAQKLKDAIVKIFNMPLENRGYIEYPHNRAIIKAANALKWHSEKIPEERKAHLFKIIKDFFDKRNMSQNMTNEEMIEHAMILPTLEKSEDFLENGKYVINQILSISRKNDNTCLCTEQCPCKCKKENQLGNNNEDNNHRIPPNELSSTNLSPKKPTSDQLSTVEEKKGIKKNKEKKLYNDKVEDYDEDSTILLHFSPSETDTDDPNSSNFEKDLEIIDAYINRCCGKNCICQCQRLPMPEQITKEEYKPNGFELPPLTKITETDSPDSTKKVKQTSKKLKEIGQNDINKSLNNENDDSPTSATSHDDNKGKKEKKDLTPEEKEKQKNPMLERFIKMWRKHFLIYTKPKYLSLSWQVSNSVYCD